jgi:glycosyltransferase involved in cell wall biosynthesis
LAKEYRADNDAPNSLVFGKSTYFSGEWKVKGLRVTENITVVMPAYNAANTIQKAVHSVLRGLSHSDELLVIDDGSTDSTLQILIKIKDERLTVLRNFKNLGVAESINRGLLSAKKRTNM